MEQRTKEAARHIDVVLSALDILDCFRDDSELTLKAIIDRTGLTRSKAMRLLGTLESRGYLVEDGETRSYHPGVKLAILGKSFERHFSLESATRSVLKKLAAQTGESATLYVVDGLERVALVREEGTHAIRLSVHEGQRLPLHAGASAKVLVAFGPPELVENILPLISGDPKRFVKEIELTRKRGYAISKGENIPDAHAIAAPVFDHKKRIIGALGIAGPANRFDDKEIDKRVKTVVDAANLLSERLWTSE
jgi:IclR family KDG regulon transcriptional repressor